MWQDLLCDHISKKKSALIYILLFLPCVIIINNVFRFYRDKTPFEIGDWLINYQGGFVRKGFLGEIFFQIIKFSGIVLK